MALAASHALNIEITARELWEKTDCVMTDSVGKNIGICKIVFNRFFWSKKVT